MTNKQKLPKPLFLLIGVIAFLVFCLPSCTDDGAQMSINHPTTVPSTTPSGEITDPTIGGISSYPVPTTRTNLEPVNMPPDMTNRITEMLETIPNTPEIMQGAIWFVDYAAWDEVFGIKRDDYRDSLKNTNTDSENAYIRDLILSPYDSHDTTRQGWYPWLGWTAFISGMGSSGYVYPNRDIIMKMPIRTTNIGYGPLDTDRSIITTIFDKERAEGAFIEAIKGTYDTDAIDQYARTFYDAEHCATLANLNGISIYSWDSKADFERMLDPPVFDGAGQGPTLAVQPQYIFGSVLGWAVDDMIDASQGTMKSLADEQWSSELAGKLEIMGTMSAKMSYGSLRSDRWDGMADQYYESLSKMFHGADLYAPLMAPYIAYASGLGVDENGLFVSLVMLYESPDAAKGDVSALENRLANGMNSTNDTWKKEVTSSEIWSDGNTLCAKLYGNVTSYWDCFVTQEPLLVRGN